MLTPIAIARSGFIASGQVGWPHHSSGAARSGQVADAAVNSGNVGSGSIGRMHLSSGAVNSGHLANISVLSGTIASGSIDTYHMASGAAASIAQNVVPFLSGGIQTIFTEEAISGVRAVAMSQSGRLRIAMAGISGRMPAIGVVVEGVLSGIQANVAQMGAIQLSSGLANYSGSLGFPLFVGRSGQIVTQSGSFNSGGLIAFSGQVTQKIGTVFNSGGALLHVVPKLDDLFAFPAEGRLTLQSATSVPSGDLTAITTVRYVPHIGNRIALYDGVSWKIYMFLQVSVAVPATTNTPFDVFIYDNVGVIAMETVNWTNDTTRATALVTQDGIYVKSGDVTRRYVGTCRTTGVSGECEDSVLKRFVWNLYNQVPRDLAAIEDTDSWTYSTATYRQTNANAANQVEVVIGLFLASWIQLYAHSIGGHSEAGHSLRNAIGEDSTSSPITDSDIGLFTTSAAAIVVAVQSFLVRRPAIGYHFYAWLERGDGIVTYTWYGDAGAPTLFRSGLRGYVLA